MAAAPSDVTLILNALSGGNRGVLDTLLPAVSGGGAPHLPIDDVVAVARTCPDDILWVDRTLDRLEVSPATVKRDWTMARAWLIRELGQTP